MKKHYSLIHAEKVLSLLKKSLKKHKIKYNKDEITILCFSNGREQGFCLKIMPIGSYQWKKICFAQQRISDNIFVVHGDEGDFDTSTNMPSDELWENYEHYFEFPNDEAAVAYISGFIIKTLKGEKKCQAKSLSR